MRAGACGVPTNKSPARCPSAGRPPRTGMTQIHRRQRRAHVRRHVVVAFRGVDEERVAVGHEPLEKRLQIAPHIRIGVFLDEQRSRSMPQMQCQQAVLELVFVHPFFDLAREFIKPAPARRNGQFVKSSAVSCVGHLDYWMNENHLSTMLHPTIQLSTNPAIHWSFIGFSPGRPFRTAFSPGPDWAAGRRRAPFHSASAPVPAAAAAG